MISSFFSHLGKDSGNQSIVIVSGLPRSGTSMMMKMLEAGGMTPLTDEHRTADIDNPGGYYEFERVKKLPKGDITWLIDAQGRVVKVIATLLPYLPTTYNYRIIFMHRAMSEILASQRKMLINRGENSDKISDQELARLFEKHLSQVDTWIEKHSNVKRIDMSYNQLLENPEPHAKRICEFLGDRPDVGKMIQVITPKLYRQRTRELQS